MSVFVIYRAIPPDSTLYSRLQREKAFGILLVNLFICGGSFFRFFEQEPLIINDVLKEVIERHQEVFGSELEASQIIGEFRSEIRHTRQVYLGIEDRGLSLERTCSGIMKRLRKELSRRQFTHVGVQGSMEQKTTARLKSLYRRSFSLRSCSNITSGNRWKSY